MNQRSPESLSLQFSALGAVLPLHAVVDCEGCVRHVGPTLDKVLIGRSPVGENFLELFKVERPRQIQDLETLAALGGSVFHLRPRQFDGPPMVAVMTELDGRAGYLVDFSFGFNVMEAVGAYRLTAGDFAATDPTMEMLYLAEANTAVMGEARRLIGRLHGQKLAAEHLSQTDTLTGLGNRRALSQALDEAMASATLFAVMNFDLDFFKQVNDRFGHAAGDHVLRQVARVLKEEIRSQDIAARVGGDEFTVMMKHVTLRDASRIADRLLRRLAPPIPYEGSLCRVSASIGLALSSEYGGGAS